MLSDQTLKPPCPTHFQIILVFQSSLSLSFNRRTSDISIVKPRMAESQGREAGCGKRAGGGPGMEGFPLARLSSPRTRGRTWRRPSRDGGASGIARRRRLVAGGDSPSLLAGCFEFESSRRRGALGPGLRPPLGPPSRLRIATPESGDVSGPADDRYNEDLHGPDSTTSP